ncbi:hypothetical protein J6590_005644, partial [Homalodisca vitripennis]
MPATSIRLFVVQDLIVFISCVEGESARLLRSAWETTGTVSPDVNKHPVLVYDLIRCFKQIRLDSFDKDTYACPYLRCRA